MKEKFEIKQFVYLEENQNVIVYCPHCHISLFTGSDRDRRGLRSAKEAIWDHNSGDREHQIDVIYPRRKSEQIIDGDVYTANGAMLTLVADAIHQENQEDKV